MDKMQGRNAADGRGAPLTRRYRHEYKYMIDARQEGILAVRAGAVMQLDSHVLSSGAYQIRSVYLDDAYDTCLSENISGTDPRAKFRIRYYNNDTSRIVLEKKSKCRGMGFKESCRLSVEECQQFLRGEIPNLDDSMPDKKKALLTEARLRGMMPKVIVTYDRIPYIYSGGNVRITFDKNITSSTQLDRFLTGDYYQRPVLPCGQTVLEVKWDAVMPLHIKETMQLERLNWTAFSKYYMCRRFPV